MFPGITVLKELVRLFNSRLSFAEYLFGVRFRNLQMPFIIYNIFNRLLPLNMFSMQLHSSSLILLGRSIKAYTNRKMGVNVVCSGFLSDQHHILKTLDATDSQHDLSISPEDDQPTMSVHSA